MDAALRRTTFWVLWVFVFAVPWQQGALLSGSVGTPARVVGLLAAVAGTTSLLLFGRRQRLLDAHCVAGVLALWALASVLWSNDPGVAFSGAVTYLQLVAFFVLVWEFATERGDVERLLWAYVAGAVVSAIGVITVARDIPLDERASAFGYNANDQAMIMVLAVPMALYLSMRTRWVPGRVVAFAAAILFPIATLTTGSRGAVVALAVALLYLPLSWRRFSPTIRVAVVAAGVIVAGSISTVVPADTLNRLGTIGTEVESGDLNERLPLWRAAMDSIEAHPVIGIGVRNSRLAIDSSIGVAEQPHNTFLSVATDLGGVGLALFVVIILLVGLRALHLPAFDRIFSLVLLAALLVTLVPAHWELQKATWVVLAVVAVIGRQPAAELSSTFLVPPPATRLHPVVSAHA